MRPIPETQPELSGSTHEQRWRYLSEQIQKVSPIAQPELFHILFDLYLLSLDHDQRVSGG